MDYSESGKVSRRKRFRPRSGKGAGIGQLRSGK